MPTRSRLLNTARSKQVLHHCACPTCSCHPYGKVAQEHTAINRVLLGLDERNKRRFVGLLASQRGNILELSQITGLSRNTIYRGQGDLRHPSPDPTSGIRQAGGGRLPVEKNNRES